MSRNTVTETDQGWQRIKDEISAAQGAGVNVGILSDETETYEDGTDMLLVAAANEFGTADGHIPPRPFIRGSFDQQSRALQVLSERLWNQVLAGRLTARNALGLLGEEHQGQVQDYIVALQTPPNAPSTIAQKGSSNPLNDEGRLRNAIRWEHDL